MKKELKTVYVIESVYCHPSKRMAGRVMNMAFSTRDEAERYCAFHENEMTFMAFHEIPLGKFNKKYKK